MRAGGGFDEDRAAVGEGEVAGVVDASAADAGGGDESGPEGRGDLGVGGVHDGWSLAGYGQLFPRGWIFRNYSCD